PFHVGFIPSQLLLPVALFTYTVVGVPAETELEQKSKVTHKSRIGIKYLALFKLFLIFFTSFMPN
ncbi:MAG: hypothetical protein ACXVHW_10940, partial [Methanobacterium sp.]